MKTLIDRLAFYGQEYGFKINYGKSKMMIIDRGNSITNKPSVASYEVVQSFVYLGALIHESGSIELEIRHRIQLSRTTMIQLNRIWQDRNNKIYKD